MYFVCDKFKVGVKLLSQQDAVFIILLLALHTQSQKLIFIMKAHVLLIWHRVHVHSAQIFAQRIENYEYCYIIWQDLVTLS